MIFSTGGFFHIEAEVGASIQHLKMDFCDKANAVKMHCIGKQWNFRKGPNALQ